MTEGIVTPIASSSTARGSGGRAIGYAEFGDPNGKPVMLFHGFGDSRLTRYPDDELTARLGIRLITFDRPGIGLTDPMKELTILDRTDDVVDLAKSLGLGDFSVLGWSGGAPYALAAAGCMAGKVRRVAIVSGFGPFERPGFKRLAPREIKRVMTILKVAPWMANVMATESQKQLQGNAAGAMEASRGLGGSADAAVLNMSGVRTNVTSGAEEAFRQGPAGVANDMLLLFRFKWGFNPEDVHTPVDLWYGDSDQMTPPDVGRGLASVLPQPRLRMVPGAGHLLYLRNWEEILRTLVADEAPATTTTFQAITPVAPISSVTESLAAASLSGTTPAPEEDDVDAQPALEPVAADGDVLGSTPAWSWMQPAAASQPAVEAPVEQAATPRPRPAAAGSDQLARLRALGFVVDEPEPETVEPVEDATGPEVEAAVESEAGVVEPELTVVEAAGDAEPEAEFAEAEPEAEAARPQLTVVEPDAPTRRPSLNWQPMRVPGLIIGRPRVVAPVEPAEPAAEDVEVAEPAAEATPIEAVAEAGTLEPEIEPEAAVEGTEEHRAAPALDSAEAERLRAAGFLVSAAQPVEVEEAETELEVEAEAEAEIEAPAAADVEEPAAETPEPAPEVSAVPEISPAAPVEEPHGARLAADELARLRSAGFSPSEPGAEVVAPEEVELTGVAALPEEPVEPEQSTEALVADAEPVVVAEPEQVETEPEQGETEPELVETEPELVEAERAEHAEAAVDEAPHEAAEPEPAAAMFEGPAPDVTTPEFEPSSAIAASASQAPAAQTSAGASSYVETDDQPAVETGVGWVETVAMEAAAVAAPDLSHAPEPDTPPEPMVAEAQDEPAEAQDEPAMTPAPDETLERLRAAGFLVGEPRRG